MYSHGHVMESPLLYTVRCQSCLSNLTVCKTEFGKPPLFGAQATEPHRSHLISLF